MTRLLKIDNYIVHLKLGQDIFWINKDYFFVKGS